MELKRVVVTGLGAVTPVGNTPEETWANLLAGKSGAAPITHFDTTNFKTKFACEVKDLNVADYIDRKEARKMDRYTQLAIISAMQGIKDSGLDMEKEDRNRIGVVYGVGIGGIKTFEDEVTYYGQHLGEEPKFNPFFIPKMIADIAAGHISIRLAHRQQMLWLMPSISFVWVRSMLWLAVVLRLQYVAAVLVDLTLCTPSQHATTTLNVLRDHLARAATDLLWAKALAA